MRKIVQCSIVVFAVLLLFTLGAHHPPVLAQEASWRPVDMQTGQMSALAEIEQLAFDFPDSGSVRLRLLNAALEAGDMELAFAQAMALANRGYRFSDGAQAQLLSIFAGQDAGGLEAAFAKVPDAVLASAVEATVPAEAKLVEGIVVRPAGGDLAVSTVVSREVWNLRGGEWRAYSYEHLGNLSGIVFDEVRGAWLASGNLGMLPEGDEAFAGLVRVTAATVQGEQFAAPEGANLSDIALGRGGTVYASDPLGGGIYRLRPDADEIETLVPPGTFRSPQGLAESADGKRLYVSDYRYGLAAVVLETGMVQRLTTELSILLDGIDALQLHGDELIAVQNGTSPMQIVALELDNDGLSITGHRILERDHPEWSEPLAATIHNGRLYYIANGEWGSFAEGGELSEGAELVPTIIRSLPLDPPPMAETP